MPRPEQLALDTPVSPARILLGQPHHQIPHLVADRWTAGPVRIRPTPLDQPAMPRQRCHDNKVAGVTRQCSRTQRGSSRASPDNTARSGHDRFGLPT